MDGAPISAVAWPSQSVVVAVHRDDDLLVPRGDLVLREGDRVAVLAAAGEAEEVRGFLASGPGPLHERRRGSRRHRERCARPRPDPAGRRGCWAP